jgi:2'-5' RNA ligase
MAETALVVLVPELEVVIGEWYRQHTEAGRRGLAPHLTLLYPFLDWAEYDEVRAARLVGALAPFTAFEVSLAETARFRGESATLYVRPEPSQPFAAMTEALTTAFPDHAPYGGEFDEITPHLTVAQGPDSLLDPIEHEVVRRLPVSVRVERVWLVADTPRGWERRAAFPLF